MVLGYEPEDMTKGQIGAKVATDPEFAILFFVANQPEAYYEAAESRGYEDEAPMDDPEPLVKWMLARLQEEPADVASMIAEIPYDQDRGNWTGDVPKPSSVKKADLSSVVPTKEESENTTRRMSISPESQSTETEEPTEGFDWGGVGETAGAVGPLICGFVDSCDASAYGGSGGKNGSGSGGGSGGGSKKKGLSTGAWIAITGVMVMILAGVGYAIAKSS